MALVSLYRKHALVLLSESDPLLPPTVGFPGADRCRWAVGTARAGVLQRLCRLQEAVLQASDLTGLQFMQRGIATKLYAHARLRR